MENLENDRQTNIWGLLEKVHKKGKTLVIRNPVIFIAQNTQIQYGWNKDTG